MSVLNLKTKMVLSVSLITAVLLVGTGLCARQYFVQQMKELVFSQQFNMLSAIADQTDDKLAALRTELVATAGTLDQAIVSDPARIRQFFQGRPDTLAMFDNGLYLFLPEGRLIYNYPVDHSMIGRDFSHRSYLQKTLATRAPHISEPFISLQGHRHPIIMFTAPVLDDKGEIAAVLAGSLDLTKENFLSKLASIRLGEHGYLYLYDGARTVISHRDRSRILKQEVTPGVDTLYDKAAAGFEGTGEARNSSSQAVIASFKRIKATGWILASNLPECEAYAPVYRAERFLLVSLLVVFILSFLVVGLCMERLTAPLISFTRQIRRLTEEKEAGSTRISVETGDEIGVLGMAFNGLLEELENQKRELQQQLNLSQRVIDTTPVPVFYKDADGRYLGCNKAFEEFTGISRQVILGKTVFDIAPPHLAQRYHDADRELAEKQELQTYETRVVHRDGSEHDVLFFKTGFPAADGTTAGLIGAMLDITERKKTQSELEAQKEFAERLVLNSSVPTFVLDRDHRLIFWNHACESLTGFTAGELAGSDQLWKVFYGERHPVLADLVLDGMQDSLAQHYQIHSKSGLVQDGVQAETWYVDRAGNRHYLTMSAAPIRDVNGSLIGAIETLEDITERKLVEEAHEETRRRLQLILDAAGEGIYGVDLQGRVTFMNPAAEQMLGWRQEELLGRHQHAMVHHSKPDGTPYPAAECPIVDAIREGRSHQGPDLFWRKDGSSFPVEFVSTPIVANGERVGAVGIFKDITERRRTEEQLLKLSQAVVQSPVAIMITDPAGDIEYVNPKFSEMSGYHGSEVIGKNPRLLKSGRTPDEVYKRLWSTIASGDVWAGEIYNKHKTGETYWQHATISPIRNASGAISHFMAFIENVTERKRLEEQLRQAQKMEAIGQMAGGVAHDFNNILTVIIGFGQLLQHTLDMEDPRRPHMAQIMDAADRATHLTKSLLAFSRKQVMLLQQVELNELARKHTKFLGRVIGEDITLSTVFSEEQLTVMADGGQIEQVLMNLATNARDAMPGGGELTIRTQSVQLGNEFHQLHGYGMPGRYALITIADNGSGMDTETQQKIFEPFFTTKPVGRGTGLGMSIVYGIVKQHGGYITVASQPGFGTTFSIYLPIATAQPEVVRQAATLMPQGGQETILVVEDDPAVRRLVESVLRRFGYDVIVAESGEEAIEIFEAHAGAVSLALLDVIMPKMNGLQVCEALRARSPQIKVLFLSGYTADIIQAKGIRIEGVELLAKPAKPLELAKKVRDMLDAA